MKWSVMGYKGLELGYCWDGTAVPLPGGGGCSPENVKFALCDISGHISLVPCPILKI